MRENCSCTLNHISPYKGMLATSCLNLINEELSPADTIYEDYYRNEPFVRILPLWQTPETKYVAGSNYIDIELRYARLNVYCNFGIDNLGKGSASQAVQALNIMPVLMKQRIVVFRCICN